jgi:3D (Asp-Asp-Asp) domain-containing protein
LWSAGYILFAADQLIPPADTPLSPGLRVILTHSRPVIIQTQVGDVIIRTTTHKIGEALEAAHLSPQGLDYSVPATKEPIPSNGKMRLIRVTEQVMVEQTPLPFETEYQPVSDLDLDSQSILQNGEYGLTAQRVRIRYEDGKEASRQVESQWVARQPQPRIVGYGTQVTMHTTTVDGGTIQYWRALNMYATSYHPSEGGGTTASGLPLQKGVAAVDTSLVSFFTHMYVPGYGEVIAADIGGGVIGRWIDLGYSDDDYVPWHSWVTVYFLWPPPDNIVWIVP